MRFDKCNVLRKVGGLMPDALPRGCKKVPFQRLSDNKLTDPPSRPLLLSRSQLTFGSPDSGTSCARSGRGLALGPGRMVGSIQISVHLAFQEK
jgi:hypothetical protein